MTCRNLSFLFLFALLSLGVAVRPAFGQAAHGQAPTVALTTVEKSIPHSLHRYPGRLSSPAQVELVARVSGELLSLGFEEGSRVQEGQLLYQLEDVRYDASVKSCEAAIARCEASLKYTKANYERVLGLYEKEVSTLDAMESARMSYETDAASLASAKASLITAKDDLKNTRIYSPITGKIGKTAYTKGNYLTPSSGVLATVVQTDPLRITFSMSNRDFLRLFGTEDVFRDNGILRIQLADGTEYDQPVAFEFLDNKASRTTDTVVFSAKVPNPDGRLVADSSVSVQLTRRGVEPKCAVPPSAVMSDNTSSYVWVVDDQNVAHRRNVERDDSDGNSQWIASGLSEGERVIVEGTHKVMRDGTAVQPVER